MASLFLYSLQRRPPATNLGARPRSFLKAASSPLSAMIRSASSKHQSACCAMVGSVRRFPPRNRQSICFTRCGFPTPPRATMTAAAPVASAARTASSAERMSPEIKSGTDMSDCSPSTMS